MIDKEKFKAWLKTALCNGSDIKAIVASPTTAGEILQLSEDPGFRKIERSPKEVTTKYGTSPLTDNLMTPDGPTSVVPSPNIPDGMVISIDLSNVVGPRSVYVFQGEE